MILLFILPLKFITFHLRQKFGVSLSVPYVTLNKLLNLSVLKFLFSQNVRTA